MHIAQIAPLTEAIPPKLYGGTERVVANLCDALVQLGHEVTLFAAADAQTDAKLIPVRDRPIRLDPAPLKSDVAAHLTMLHEVRRRAWQFDILHFHIDLLHFPVFEHQAQRTVTTLHGRLDLTDLEAAYGHWRQFGLVSISDHQRTPLPFVNWLATIPHGLPSHQFVFRARPQPGYLAFLGRISPEKRPDRRDLDRAPRRHPAEDRGEGRQGRSRLLRDAHRTAPRPSVDRLHRRDRREARSRIFSVMRARCCSRSTGRSRSGW